MIAKLLRRIREGCGKIKGSNSCPSYPGSRPQERLEALIPVHPALPPGGPIQKPIW
jgi:hypothetical protein